jgi:hypothetical protein
MIQMDDQDSESNERNYEQDSMLCLIYEFTMKIMSKGANNQLFKLDGSHDENPAGSLQKYGALGYERNRKHSFSNRNSRVLQLIPWTDNSDFL